MTVKKSFYLFLIVLAVLAGCSEAISASDLRAQRASNSNGDILIGIVEGEKLPKHAAQMAVDEINQSGGVLGRQLMVSWQDDNWLPSRGKRIAQDYANNIDVVAVIGHNTSAVSMPTSAIYEFAGILMLSPAATSPRLTEQGFNLVFRNTPSDQTVGQQVSEYLARQDYTRIVILSAKNDYGHGLSNGLELNAPQHGITVVDRASYHIGETNFTSLIKDWQELNFDAIFIAGSSTEAAYFIHQADQAGLSQQIIGSDGIIADDLWQIAGDSANGVRAISYFHPSDQRPEVQHFVQAYQDQYGVQPDVWSASIYDAVNLLAYAFETAGSTVPSQVAETLHNTQNWPGVTGPHSFDQNGDVISKPIIITEIRDGQFIFLESFEEH